MKDAEELQEDYISAFKSKDSGVHYLNYLTKLKRDLPLSPKRSIKRRSPREHSKLSYLI